MLYPKLYHVEYKVKESSISFPGLTTCRLLGARLIQSTNFQYHFDKHYQMSIKYIWISRHQKRWDEHNFPISGPFRGEFADESDSKGTIILSSVGELVFLLLWIRFRQTAEWTHWRSCDVTRIMHIKIAYILQKASFCLWFCLIIIIDSYKYFDIFLNITPLALGRLMHLECNSFDINIWQVINSLAVTHVLFSMSYHLTA